jgi:hypothetical protein
MNADRVSEETDAETFVKALYTHLLRRSPASRELEDWTAAARRLAPAKLMELFTDSAEYKRRGGVDTFWPAGHYHSPVVNPDEISTYVTERENLGLAALAGLSIDTSSMIRFWDDNLHNLSTAPFTEEMTEANRFFYEGAPFPYGDAMSLYAIMGSYRPKRIVEIGSGFSTACMLDSADRHGLADLRLKCIEPYPDRLRRLLWPSDAARVEVVEQPVQRIPVREIVDCLFPNDILFIDSTHVLKTASDVHYELFYVIPALRPGVLIHVHDCPYPFEYPPKWLYQLNYSWNEAYALRAFLMYNSKFNVIFWGSLLKRLFSEKITKEGGLFSVNPGTSIWMIRS